MKINQACNYSNFNDNYRNYVCPKTANTSKREILSYNQYIKQNKNSSITKNMNQNIITRSGNTDLIGNSNYSFLDKNNNNINKFKNKPYNIDNLTNDFLKKQSLSNKSSNAYNDRVLSTNTLHKRQSIKSPEIYTSNQRNTSINNNYSNSRVAKTLLPPSTKPNKKTLVLDLDETLIHSEFQKPRKRHDFTIKVDIEGVFADVYVFVRPYVKEFITKMAILYELVIFTAALPNYANAIIDKLPNSMLISHRLYRHHCFKSGREVYIKEMKKLGRDLKDIIILDNNPPSYTNDPQNGIPITNFFDDKNDSELLKIIPMFEFLASVDDVRPFVEKFVFANTINYSYVSKLLINNKSSNGNTLPNNNNNNYKDNRYLNSSKNNDININIYNQNYSNVYLVPENNKNYSKNKFISNNAHNKTDNINKLDRNCNNNLFNTTYESNEFKYNKSFTSKYNALNTNLIDKTITNSNNSFAKDYYADNLESTKDKSFNNKNKNRSYSSYGQNNYLFNENRNYKSFYNNLSNINNSSQFDSFTKKDDNNILNGSLNSKYNANNDSSFILNNKYDRYFLDNKYKNNYLNEDNNLLNKNNYSFINEKLNNNNNNNSLNNFECINNINNRYVSTSNIKHNNYINKDKNEKNNEHTLYNSKNNNTYSPSMCFSDVNRDTLKFIDNNEYNKFKDNLLDNKQSYLSKNFNFRNEDSSNLNNNNNNTQDSSRPLTSFNLINKNKDFNFSNIAYNNDNYNRIKKYSYKFNNNNNNNDIDSFKENNKKYNLNTNNYNNNINKEFIISNVSRNNDFELDNKTSGINSYKINNIYDNRTNQKSIYDNSKRELTLKKLSFEDLSNDKYTSLKKNKLIVSDSKDKNTKYNSMQSNYSNCLKNNKDNLNFRNNNKFSSDLINNQLYNYKPINYYDKIDSSVSNYIRGFSSNDLTDEIVENSQNTNINSPFKNYLNNSLSYNNYNLKHNSKFTDRSIINNNNFENSFNSNYYEDLRFKNSNTQNDFYKPIIYNSKANLYTNNIRFNNMSNNLKYLDMLDDNAYINSRKIF